MKKQDKVSKGEILIFGAGDLFGGGAQLIISFYYLIFLTDIIKIRPALAGVVILFSKVWDAISDPLMGLITDNTNTRWGRRKPYFLIGFFGIVAAFFLLWYPISNDSQMIKFLYMLFAYLLYSSVSTMVMVPYSAMSSEISQDYEERNIVNGTRLFFSQLSSLICAVVPMEIVKLFADERAGYIAMAISFGFFFAIPFLLMFFFTKERVEGTKEDSKFDISFFLKPFKVKAFRNLIMIYLSAFLAMDIVSTVFAYYMNYYLKRPGELNYVLGAMLITQVIMVFAVIKLANKIGKAKTVMVSIAIWAVGILLMSQIQPTWPAWVIYVDAVIMGLGIIGCVVMPWTMYPDITDVGELAFGRRSSGSFSGIMTFMRKFSSAVGIFIVSYILDIAGYIEPIEDGVQVIMQDQPEAVITALKVIVILFPFVLLFFTFRGAMKYPLNRQLQKRLMIYLDYKNGKLAENPLTKDELENMKKSLI
ncbi:MAG: MFS transporter [Clostridiales bacterium]|nr:MFS transporter [Clostridiales bacterium]